jgi:hypothetical protein
MSRILSNASDVSRNSIEQRDFYTNTAAGDPFNYDSDDDKSVRISNWGAAAARLPTLPPARDPLREATFDYDYDSDFYEPDFKEFGRGSYPFRSYTPYEQQGLEPQRGGDRKGDARLEQKIPPTMDAATSAAYGVNYENVMRDEQSKPAYDNIREFLQPFDVKGVYQPLSKATRAAELVDLEKFINAYPKSSPLHRPKKMGSDIDNALRALRQRRNSDVFGPVTENSIASSRGVEVGCGDLCARLWQHIKKQHPSERDNLSYSLTMALAQCIEEDGHRVCSDGTVQRLIAVIKPVVPEITKMTVEEFWLKASYEYATLVDGKKDKELNARILSTLQQAPDSIKDYSKDKEMALKKLIRDFVESFGLNPKKFLALNSNKVDSNVVRDEKRGSSCRVHPPVISRAENLSIIMTLEPLTTREPNLSYYALRALLRRVFGEAQDAAFTPDMITSMQQQARQSLIREGRNPMWYSFSAPQSCC